MIRVENGEITGYQLPTTGILKDGSSVSGYNLLDMDILLSEGWLPLEDNEPSYDIETEYLADDGYKILEDKVIKKYKVESIPIIEEVPNEIDLLNDKVVELTEMLNLLVGGEPVAE